MSSILRALKKLESDPRHLEETPLLDSKFVPLADTGPQKSAAGLIMMVFGGGIVCGLVILAGWWLFSEKTGSPPAPQEITPQNMQQAEMVSATPTKAKTPERSAPAVVPVKPAADISAPPLTTDQIPEPSPVKIPQLSSPAIKQRQDVMRVAEPGPESVAQKPSAPSPEINEQVAAQEVAVAVVRAPETSTIVTETEIPVLNDPGMKLQAITWSKDPQKRIVVINNSILRQGEAVSGYRIDTINQDDVIINDAGENWKLLFRIR